MSPELINLVTVLTSSLSVTIAIIAIIISVRAERRAEKRFLSEMALQEKTAQASVKPILAVFTSEFAENKGVVLSNAGVGTAIITNISFAKNGKEVQSLPLLFDLPEKVKWDNYWMFGSKKHYLIAGKSIDLIRLSANNLREQGVSERKISLLLKTMQEQMNGIMVKIDYQDVFGNKQEDSGRTL